MKTLNSQTEDKLLHSGASLVGFADITNLSAKITGGYPKAISIATALNPIIVRGISKGPTKKYFNEYERINNLLNKLCEQTVGTLINSGCKAKAITTTTDKFDLATLSTPFQHKTVATLAGLGWIGKSALLVTKQYGPAVRLATVLTDAELKTGEPANESHCGQCQNCQESCPAGAITGKNWSVGDIRESIYNAFDCRKIAKKLAKQQGIEATICGICINVCPWTQRYLTSRLPEQKVDITPAVADDYPALRELFVEYEACLPFDLSFQHFQREADNLPGRYAPPSGQLLLAKSGDTAIGCVALRRITDEICEMKRLYVQPAFQGQQIGRRLAEAIIEESRRIGYKTMRLDTVMKPAKNLYKSLGFVEIPPYENVPIESVVFMELILL